jgi:DNA-binding response OmpR family regulator
MPKPLQILVAEDEVLIALELEDSLRASGYEVAGPFTTCAHATEWLKTGAPDLALIDHMLRDGSCTELARELRQRGIPFAIHSGRSAFMESSLEFEGVPWIDKPTSLTGLLRALQDLVGPV